MCFICRKKRKPYSLDKYTSTRMRVFLFLKLIFDITKRFFRCCSMVGRNLQTGAQNVSLGVLCDKVGIAAHEFGHVIGYYLNKFETL